MISLITVTLAMTIGGDLSASTCGAATNCNDCIAGDYCAWCAPGDAKYPDQSSAGRCFDGRDQGATHGGAPVCHPRTQTSECVTGFVETQRDSNFQSPDTARP